MSRRHALTRLQLRHLREAAQAIGRLYDAGAISLEERTTLLEQTWIDLVSAQRAQATRQSRLDRGLRMLLAQPATHPERSR